ncbi:DUF4843 domain-containing protein [Sphingobacterium faecale]|uniref:DUF4843 domain-containing protein n=1 Tax=Sphingobacterium faecale TaxID=2803775 RepID=A0ABS1R4L3_9SPHI|nr:DUF4843 domain-containing protein [Sphingobacterium faecale]MBL1409499.1 DUF4843 domain-containing protein [Sphingobacterium faecale]
MKIVRIIIGGVLTLCIGSSCKKQDIMYYTGDDSANFWTRVQNHSFFGANEQEMAQDTVTLNVALVGKFASYDRVVRAEVVEDAADTPIEERKTTASIGQYKILPGVIPANELIGNIKVIVKNTSDLADGDLKIRLKMVESEFFKVGLRENNYMDLKWSRLVLQPVTWGAMRVFFCATYSSQVYRIFMEVTGMKELYYFEGKVSAEEATVMGVKFAKRVRELSEQQGKPLVHDDGPKKGEPIIPVY